MADEGNSKPVTKGELKTELAAMESRFDSLDARFVALDARFIALKDELIEAIRDSQTEILRAFERYAGSEQIKFRRLQADVSNIDASTSKRLDIVEERLAEIEKKLIMRPRDAA